MAKSSVKKGGAASALQYLSQPEKYPAAAVCAVYGDEVYLKGEVLRTLRRQVLSGEDEDFALTTFQGKEAQLREVLDAVSTLSLFGDGRRLVVVEEADSFVTQYRAELEDYAVRSADAAGSARGKSEGHAAISKPAARGGVLVLEVKSWPANTRLAKSVASEGLAIECRSHETWKPQERKAREREIKTWLAQRAKNEHQVRLEAAAADALLELVPPEVGVLVQEVDKLALVAGDRRLIDVELVRQNVGGWRVRAVWDMADATADGRAADALAQLDRLIAAGEKPHALLPQMASTLRRFSAALELIEEAEAQRQRLPVRSALSQAGVLAFKLGDAERQLRQIGRDRVKQLTRWLLAADLAVKGHNSADDRARIELERLIVRLAASGRQDRAVAR